MKKITTILLLTSIVGTVASTSNVQSVYAETPISTSIQVKENIDEWMPNRQTQIALLEALIDAEYMYEGQGVQDITKELLNSIPTGYIDQYGTQIGQINLVMDASKIGVINGETFKGLEYITYGTIYANIKNFSENQLDELNWKEFPSNGYKENGKQSSLLFNIANDNGRISHEMFEKLNNFAKNPEGAFEPGTLSFAMLANGNAVGTLDLSTDEYKKIIIDNADYYTGPVKNLGGHTFSMYIYDKQYDRREFIPIYKFVYNIFLKRWEGTYEPAYATMWNKIKSEPQRYAIHTQLTNFDQSMYSLGTQGFDFK